MNHFLFSLLRIIWNRGFALHVELKFLGLWIDCVIREESYHLGHKFWSWLSWPNSDSILPFRLLKPKVYTKYQRRDIYHLTYTFVSEQSWPNSDGILPVSSLTCKDLQEKFIRDVIFSKSTYKTWSWLSWLNWGGI